MTVPRNGQPSYDFILAGGGLAGLSLAWYLVHSRLRDSRILLLDKEPKQKNDRTWCYWSHVPGDFDSLASHTWSEVYFSHPAASLRIPLGAYRYRMIHGIDFYRFLSRELEGHPAFRSSFGDIRSIRDGRDLAEVEAGDERFTGRWAFNSLFRPEAFLAEAGRYVFLQQHFLGWEVETAQEAFDPTAFTMFDFRTPQRNAVRFFYVLPTSTRRALVEYTLFSKEILPMEEYQQALRVYLREILKVDRYEIVGTEFGIIPMTDYPFQRRTGKNILAIGTLGGRVKPSTGFAFRRIQADSRNIVRSLERFGNPFHIPADPWQHRFSDSAMLRIMQRSPERMADILLGMFRGNPIERIFRFLDEEIGAVDNLRLFSTLPRMELFLAGLGYVKSPVVRSAYPNRPVT